MAATIIYWGRYIRINWLGTLELNLLNRLFKEQGKW